MECSSKTWRWRRWAPFASLGLAWVTGCANLRLPAIDPTGQHIFLPPPAYTTVAPPAEKRLFQFPTPAYVVPPDPLPCAPPAITLAPQPTPVAPGTTVPGQPQPPPSLEPGEVSVGELAVTTTGPAVAELNSTLTYRIQVSNPGDLPAQNVVVTSDVPDGLSYVDSSPPAGVFGNRLEWRIDQLAARQLGSFDVHHRATRTGLVRFCATARHDDGLAREGCVTTEIRARALSVEVDGPETAEVGQQIQFRISVANTHEQPLTGVRVSDRFDLGLRHVDPARPEVTTPSPIERSLGTLSPGEVRRFAVTFIVERAGQLCHTLEVTSSEGARQSARACLTATTPLHPQAPAARPDAVSLQVRKTRVGPEQRRVGDVAQFDIDIVNQGPSMLTNIRVVDQFDPPLQPELATAGAARHENQLIWRFGTMAPGQSARIQVRYRCATAAPRACNTVTVTADQDVQLSDGACLEILAAAQATPPAEPPSSRQVTPIRPETPPQTAPSQPKGEPSQDQPSATSRDALVMTVNELGDPIRAGDQVTYIVEITNDRTVSDRNIVLTVVLPEGTSQLTTVPPPLIRHTTGLDGRTVTFSAISEMRAGETVTFRIGATLQRPGQATVRAELNSLRSSQSVTVQEETTVFAK